MNFSLDYDGTADQDPQAWKTFCNMMRLRGHKVYIVTMRYPSECLPMLEEWQPFVEAIIPTSRGPKRSAMQDLGVEIHVWIDDNPQAVDKSATEIWGTCTPEGTIMVIDQEAGTETEVVLTK